MNRGRPAGGGRPLPASARALIGAVVLGGATVAAVQLPAVLAWATPHIAAWAVLVVAMVITEQFPISLLHREEGETFALTDSIWVAALILVPPDVLLLAAAGGTLVGQIAQRVDVAKIGFNLGQYLIGLAAAVLAYQALGPGPVTDPRTWLAAAAAMSMFFVVNTGSVALVIALVTGKRFVDVLLPTLPISFLHWAGNMAIGMLGALLWVTSPLALVLLAAPLVLSYFAYSGWLRSMRERDQMHEMANTADAISEQRDLARRLPVTDRDDAVGQLSATLNAMLDRIEQAFLHELRFLSEASHELRTPITVCRANLEILLAEGGRDQVDETIGLAIDELGRMSRIVEDMTTLAQMEQTAYLRLQSVDLERFVHDLSAKAQPMLEGRLDVEPVPAGATARADSQRLTQALMNLLQNARIHPAGETRVRLSVRPVPEGWRFEVADHGGGLPPGQEEELFQPFRRGSGRHPGSGLGLAIVRAIAEAHGGAAGVDNRPGEGATFWVTFPR